MEERSLHVSDYMAVVNRRRWWLIVPIVLCLLGGAVLATILPRQYEARTTLAVTTPNVSLPAAQSDLAERVRAVQHTLLSRPVLEQVVRAEGLAGDEQSIDGAINSVRSRTSVSLPPQTLNASARTGPDTFILAHRGDQPDLTHRVTNRLAAVFIAEVSKAKNKRAEDTSAFLSTQVTQSQQKLSIVEEKLRKMKESYIGRLPEQTEANLQMVSGLRQQLESASVSLRGEQDRLASIQRSIDAMKQGSIDGPQARPGGEKSAQELVVVLRQKLTAAQGTYTDKHPEILSLKTELAAAEAAAKAEAARPESERAPALNADPVYQRLMEDAETARLRIRNLERAAAGYSADISRYQGNVAAAPMIEQQLVSLNREYELEKENFKKLSDRYQAALLAEKLEQQNAGELFTVLYPANRPSQPISPEVPKVMLFAGVLGVVLGGLLALGREYMDRAVYDARTLQAEFDLPVLAEIPRIAAH